MDWFYQWKDGQFVNVSSQYADEYRQQIADMANTVRQTYGSPLNDNPFIRRSPVTALLNILVVYNNLRLELSSGEGLDLLLNLTEVSHWPGSARVPTCWLQIARAYAEMDYEHDLPFEIISAFGCG